MTSPVLFQFLPPLAPDEYAALEASIREHGVQVPILVDEHGVVIDGHHRSAIAEHLGVHCPRTRVFDKTDAEKRTLALTLNLDRRNLNREQRRAIVEASIRADPHLSDRAHAKRAGVSPTTAGAVRASLQVSNLDTSPQRAGSFPNSTPEQVERFTTSTPDPERIDPLTGEVVPAPTFQPTNVTDWTPEEVDDLMASDEAVIEAWGAQTVPAPAKITGLDGKKYTRPKPKEKTMTTAAPPRLAIPQPPKYGGGRLKHNRIIDNTITSAQGLALVLDEIAELDGSLNAEQAASYADDLSRIIRSLKRIQSLLQKAV